MQPVAEVANNNDQLNDLIHNNYTKRVLKMEEWTIITVWSKLQMSTWLLYIIVMVYVIKAIVKSQWFFWVHDVMFLFIPTVIQIKNNPFILLICSGNGSGWRTTAPPLFMMCDLICVDFSL